MPIVFSTTNRSTEGGTKRQVSVAITPDWSLHDDPELGPRLIVRLPNPHRVRVSHTEWRETPVVCTITGEELRPLLPPLDGSPTVGTDPLTGWDVSRRTSTVLLAKTPEWLTTLAVAIQSVIVRLQSQLGDDLLHLANRISSNRIGWSGHTPEPALPPTWIGLREAQLIQQWINFAERSPTPAE